MNNLERADLIDEDFLDSLEWCDLITEDGISDDLSRCDYHPNKCNGCEIKEFLEGLITRS